MTPISPHAAEVLELLHPDEGRAYAVLDGARNKIIWVEVLAARNNDSSCLFRGEMPPKLMAAAPYLVDLRDGTDMFCRWLTGFGWGNSWGVFAFSRATMKELRKHFRSLLLVKRKGQQLYFRFYDPRVLRVFLPACSPEDLDALFGPIDAYVLESEDPAVMLRFTRDEEGGLVREELDLTVGQEATA